MCIHVDIIGIRIIKDRNKKKNNGTDDGVNTDLDKYIKFKLNKKRNLKLSEWESWERERFTYLSLLFSSVV